MRIVLAALAGVAVALGGAACGGSLGSGSSCLAPYAVHASGHTTTANTCAGVIPADPMRVSVHAGARFTIEIGHERNGGLDFPVPAPVGGGVRRSGRRGATVSYVALVPSTTTLVARGTILCVSHPDDRRASCPVALVRVTAR